MKSHGTSARRGIMWPATVSTGGSDRLRTVAGALAAAGGILGMAVGWLLAISEGLARVYGTTDDPLLAVLALATVTVGAAGLAGAWMIRVRARASVAVLASAAVVGAGTTGPLWAVPGALLLLAAAGELLARRRGNWQPRPGLRPGRPA